MSVNHIIPVLVPVRVCQFCSETLTLPPLLTCWCGISNYLTEYLLLIIYVLDIALQPPQHHPHISVSAVDAIVLMVYIQLRRTSPLRISEFDSVFLVLLRFSANQVNYSGDDWTTLQIKKCVEGWPWCHGGGSLGKPTVRAPCWSGQPYQLSFVISYRLLIRILTNQRTVN